MFKLAPLFAKRISRRLLVTLSILGVAALAGFGMLLVLVADRTDLATLSHQTKLVEHGLQQLVEKISRDQESVVYWDDAVLKAEAGDIVWLDENLGAWMYDYFGHDRTIVISPNDTVIYAMTGGKEQLPSVAANVLPLVTQEVAALRFKMANAVEDATLAERRLLIIDHRPAVVSLMPILPHSDRVSVAPGGAHILLSLQYFDRAMIAKLRDEYLLSGARISLSNELAAKEASVPIKTADGTPLAYLVWKPALPGQQILKSIVPSGVGGALLVAALIALLTQGIYRALTALEASEKRATHVALHDPLTGLPNRTLFAQLLDEALQRNAAQRPVLLMLDLDRFKEVNDTLGHQAGDELIQIFGSRIAQHLRRSDCMARLGGDEFAVLLVDIGSPDEIVSFCERVLQSALRPFEVAEVAKATVGVSIGIAVAQDAIERGELMRRADIALYAAKRGGRNCYREYSPDLDVNIREQRLLEVELRAALANGNAALEVFYQPLLDNRTDAIRGVEALLRWDHPRLGAILPAVFLPVAEASGLVRVLDEWVLRRAFRDALRWPTLSLAVNVSPRSFQKEGLAARIRQIAADEAFDLKRLEIEVTEKVLLDETAIAGSEIQSLRASGVCITLDDFGTGYAGLRQLESLRVDKVKIGRSFVQHLGQTVDSTAMVRAITEMGHALGLKVGAQGVETSAQKDFLGAVGCDSYQGHLVAKALPAWGISARYGEEIKGAA